MTHFAREYGNALYELALEEQLSELVFEQLQQVNALLRDNADYVRLLCARNLAPKERAALLDKSFGGELHPYLLNFMKMLTERGAMGYFGECADVFRMRYNEDHGIAEATVKSAVALTRAQADQLAEKLAKMTGKRILLHERVVPSLIGGVQVDLEGRRYDNSVRTRLERMRRTLVEQD